MKKALLFAALTTGMAFQIGLGGCGGGWELWAAGLGALVLLGGGLGTAQ
jgi:hypothetical protein